MLMLSVFVSGLQQAVAACKEKSSIMYFHGDTLYKVIVMILLEAKLGDTK